MQKLWTSISADVRRLPFRHVGVERRLPKPLLHPVADQVEELLDPADARTVTDAIRLPARPPAPALTVAAATLRLLQALAARQPVLLTDARSLVSVSPQPGFLHQFSELDTLGIDKPETKCRMG